MPIIKIPHTRDNPYVIMDQRPLNDLRLSWKSKGLLAYLLSKPADWEVWVKDLIKRSRDGCHAVRSAIQELVKCGYIEKCQQHLEDGTFGPVVYIVREQPLSGFPQADKPQAEKCTYTNKDSTSVDSTSKNQETAAPSEPTPVTFQQWGDLLRETRTQHGNIVAVLVWMHNTLYPDHDPASYGRMGNLPKRVGGVMRVAQLLWETSTRPPAGRVCDFIEAVAKRRFKDEHDPDKPFKMG